MYKFIAALSVIIRTFYLPNPFDSLGTTFPVTIGENTLTMTPIVMNYLAEPVLHALTFALVGLYYSRGEHNPSKGSFLYLMFYCVHVGLLYLILASLISSILIKRATQIILSDSVLL